MLGTHEENTEFEKIDMSDNAENFDAASFLERRIPDLRTKTKAFNTEIKKLMNNGFIFRRIHGKTSKYTPVEDARTGVVTDLIMLGSNNYLDLAVEHDVQKRVGDAVNKYGVGCGGPAVLNGYTNLHRELELKLAESKGCEDAIIFSSGYSANVGWPAALLEKDDFLVYDMKSHGSLFDGIAMGNFNSVPFHYNDPISLEARVKKIRDKNPLANIIVCAEGVYSMDGDVAPLDQYKVICEKYNCFLSIDDAHGTGVMGEKGHGTQEHFGLQGEVDICMGTFSKALTSTGGYVAASEDFINYLRVNANSYIYSATVSPIVIATALGCLEFIERNPERVQQLHHNTQYFVKGLNGLGFDAKSDSAIIPIFVNKDIKMREIIYRFHQRGIFINGIEYPSVPRNKQRLRISMMATFTERELDYALSIFEEVGREFKLI